MRVTAWSYRSGWVLALTMFAGMQGHAQGREACPDDGPWFGKVQIWTFGFEFVVPKGLRAYWNSAVCGHEESGECVCMGDHGRIVPLKTRRDTTDRQIEMYADLGASLVDDFTLNGAVRQQLDTTYQEDVTRERVIENRRFRLAGRTARRVVFRYVDRKSGRRMVEDSVVCLTHRRPAEYILYLRTPVEDYAKDRVIFEAMVRSFRWTPGEYGAA